MLSSNFFLSKATWYLGSFLLIVALVINLFFLPGKTSTTERESIIQSSQQQTAVPTQPAIPENPPADAPPPATDTPAEDEGGN